MDSGNIRSLVGKRREPEVNVLVKPSSLLTSQARNFQPEKTAMNVKFLEPNTTTDTKTKMVELAEKFLKDNIRRSLKPRIFPMENTYGIFDRVPLLPPFPNSFHIGHKDKEERNSDKNEGKTQIHLEIDDRLGEKEKFDNNFLRALRSSPSLSIPSDFEAFQFQNGHVDREVLMAAILTSGYTSRFNPCVGSVQLPKYSVMMNSPSRHRRESSGSCRPDFATALRKWNAPIPPALSRKLGRAVETPLGKVKVMLRISENSDDTTGTLGVDPRKKQVTLIDPGGRGGSTGNNGTGITPEERRVGVLAPKMFAFDGIFGDDSDQTEICAASASELVASVMGGEDGCFVSLGSPSTGTKQTMFGKPSNQKMGVVPTTISWLFKSIQEQKQKAGSRFSLRVSALTITGGPGHEVINDLLIPFAVDGDQPPGAYLTPQSPHGQSPLIPGTHKFTSTSSILNNISEVRAQSPERAGFYFDTALSALEIPGDEFSIQHFLFTLHLYQYTATDKNGRGVIGGRSRLHCIKLGNGSPSISVLGGLLLAVLNGQRHLPSRDSKLGAILRECLGSLTCRAVVMIHVSNAHSRYAETLSALQLGSRVHRLRRSRRLKMGSVGSGTGSGGSSGGSGEEMRNGSSTISSTPATICEGETGSSDIDPSSSEQSCDTVIYLGPSIDDCTDGENPPIYLPSLDASGGEIGLEIKTSPPKNSIPSTSSSIPSKSISSKSSKLGSTAKHHHTTTGTSKSEEQWVDGPKLNPKYQNGSGTCTGTSNSNPKKTKSETWIDGPVSRLVNHQANNFPSPKKSIEPSPPLPLNLPSLSTINPAKAQMIQQWITNQSTTHSPFDDETNFIDTSMYLAQGGHCVHSLPCKYYTGDPYSDCSFLNCSHHRTDPEEPEYKSLTVFKTCSDDLWDEDEGNYPSNGFEFEFIEVVEPEIPVPTADACLQVTEEDIALSFLEENPLPESDQNLFGNVLSYTTIARSIGGSNDFVNSVSAPNITSSADCGKLSTKPCDTEIHEIGFLLGSNVHRKPKLTSSAMSEKSDDHPLRVLSQECLTVVSSFTDSMSLNGDLERFWPRLSLAEESMMSSDKKNGVSTTYHHHNHGLCKNLASLSQMSLDTEENSSPPGCCIYKSSSNDEPGVLSPLSTLRNTIKTSEISSIASVRSKSSITAPIPPILSDESIFKVPKVPQHKGGLENVARENGVTEQESMVVPPMKLLDLTPIKATVETINLPATAPNCKPLPLNRGCDHNHHQQQPSLTLVSVPNSPPMSIGSNAGINPQSDFAPTKSPKTKSRKIAKFFRGRSKSPKKSSESSGKSSGSSTVSAATSSSSGASSYSSANSPSTNQLPHSAENNNRSTIKYHQHHSIPSPQKSPAKITKNGLPST